MSEGQCGNFTQVDPKHKRRIWQEHIECWQHSGQSQVGYCREHHLKLHQFTYWKSKLTQTDDGISFLPLRVSHILPVAAASSTLSLFTPNGYRIEVGAGFDEPTLKRLVKTVQTL